MSWSRNRPTPSAAKVAKYNSPEHRAARAHYRTLVEAGLARCWRCGRQLMPGHWHVGHDDTGQRIMGAECARCNVRAAARKGNRMVRAKQRAERFTRAVR